MKRDFFKNLPSEITTNILSRLPLRTISISKCVCKPWLHLLETDVFVNSHLAKSVPTLAVSVSSSCSIFEFEDGQDLEQHDHHYKRLTKFALPDGAGIRGSANGLLFLFKGGDTEAHYVCNPITREYAEVRCPKELLRPYPKVVDYPEILGESLYSYPPTVTYGFGASKITGQHKVVRIYHDCVIADQLHGGGRRIIPEVECHVHTLGTQSWRRVEPLGAPFEYSVRSTCVFLNGNLHWMVSDSESKLWISCFDLEAERFSTFSTPPVFQESFELVGGLSALGDCLCFCDHTREEETVIWLMKEYGVEKSWSKEYVIKLNDGDSLYIEGSELVYPIKVFEDGDILMLQEARQLFYYSNKTQNAHQIGIFDAGHVNPILVTPSFLSIKSLRMENVISF